MDYGVLKGNLSFMVLWLIDKNKETTGKEIVDELERRIDRRLNPGTIYPALDRLKKKKLIEIQRKIGKDIYYSLTQEGQKELKASLGRFKRLFHDIK